MYCPLAGDAADRVRACSFTTLAAEAVPVRSPLIAGSVTRDAAAHWVPLYWSTWLVVGVVALTATPWIEEAVAGMVTVVGSHCAEALFQPRSCPLVGLVVARVRPWIFTTLEVEAVCATSPPMVGSVTKLTGAQDRKSTRLNSSHLGIS